MDEHYYSNYVLNDTDRDEQKAAGKKPDQTAQDLEQDKLRSNAQDRSSVDLQAY